IQARKIYKRFVSFEARSLSLLYNRLNFVSNSPGHPERSEGSPLDCWRGSYFCNFTIKGFIMNYYIKTTSLLCSSLLISQLNAATLGQVTVTDPVQGTKSITYEKI